MKKEVHSFVRVPLPCREVFPYFFSLNLLEICKGFWVFPDIKSGFFKTTSAQPGSVRLIYFEDFSTARCQLSAIVPEVSFSVHIEGFSSRCFNGLESIDCHFAFSDLENVITNVHSHYQFKLKWVLWDVLFDLFLHRVLQKKLDKVLVHTARELKFFTDWKLALD
ncbi:hypothetical protein AAEO57_10145 [Flavobacterium sp. DGU38]|uniref:Polyketide cyclase / dehydrase and lipid transport n=1 Tax=Flavobacterium calami TaxID=3139144 RepID=A0ABU9IR30_9FLAO